MNRAELICVAMISILLTFDGVGSAESTTAAPLQTAGVNQPLTVSLRVDLQPKQEVGGRSLLPGDVAHRGDHFTLTAWVNQPAYLYILAYEPKGWSTRLFPVRGDVSVKKDLQIHLPGNGAGYLLNDQPGDIEIYAYASSKPMDADACAHLRLDCSKGRFFSTRGGDKDQKKSEERPPPPPGRSAKERHGNLIVDSAVHTVSARADDRGVALLRFHFKHIP